MKTSEEIDALPIEEVKAGFSDMMSEIVTTYGDNLEASEESTEEQ